MKEFDDTVTEIAAAQSLEALEAIRVKVLGRRGSLTVAMRELGALDPEERRRAGATLNAAKERITAALAETTVRLGRAQLGAQLTGERADVTLPVNFAAAGRTGTVMEIDAYPDRADLSSDLIRLARKGLAKPSGGEGDLYAIVQIVNPTVLNDRERELFKELGEQSKFDPRAHFARS